MTRPSLAMTPETDGVDRVPDFTTLRLGDFETPIVHMSMTFESLPCRAWSHRPIELGERTVTGQITANFMVDRAAIERFMNASMNLHLRMCRPHMPKRMFQRMRGRIKAQRRADRFAAAAAKTRPHLNALWYETKVNLALRALPAGADHGEIGAIVARLAPGWDYVDATRIGDAHPRVALGMYDPDSPL